MRLVIATFLVAAPATADQSLPDGGAWTHRCAAILERTRVATVRPVPQLRTMKVGSVDKGIGLTRDPLAVWVTPRRGVEVVEGAWREPPPWPIFGPGAHDPKLALVRRRGDRLGHLYSDELTPRPLAAFATAFRRAGDQ